MTLSKRENKIGVSRTSLVLGRSRTRLVLGELGLGGDDLDGGANELPAVTMGVFFAGAGVRSHWCWDAISLVLQAAQSHWCWGATRLVRSGVGADARCDETVFWCDLLALSLSLSSIFLGCNSFEGKIEPEIILRLKCLILQLTWNTNSV